MKEREQIIADYFESWIYKNKPVLAKTFAPDIIYTECYGPEYHGLAAIEQWFDDWNTKGTVLCWEIKQFIHQGSSTAVEWYFQCEYESEIGDFDGVSLIEFNAGNRIVRLKEFQSKTPHYYPYGENEAAAGSASDN
ncbi:nuclear transport factor 2 family protein [Paenibacillus sp. MMS20-IR301]|uniref:nuclear transport factor 2 family protein n=1 Tax=Paenibacillus sp. MMS20-IR301 TaxID=2895946 RepID=UPI0028F15482|nr:nuclear transport factor 2 family protein [Paenibacillus sp. MMS20-IR301]WNS45019.1 nuclear transport factor 2 family protein [Paenibacillus sp. MMS20-IR301]